MPGLLDEVDSPEFHRFDRGGDPAVRRDENNDRLRGVAGWTCAAVVGQENDVCECEAATEICNGRDDDCNGIVDDEPRVGMRCSDDLGGAAVCSDGSCACDNGHTSCDDTCVLLGSDPDNCGACGNACVPNATCQGGACICDGETCDGVCVDPGTDEDNCGQCGTHCPTGASCQSGECSCPAGQEACGESCVNLTTDDDNCGGCGYSCLASSYCYEGSCDSDSNYPFPDAGGICPDGTALAALDGWAICAPLCGAGGSCPQPEGGGDAIYGCGLADPGSSMDCEFDSDCPDCEICYPDSACHFPPWGCAVACDQNTDCPHESLWCVQGLCLYPYDP